MEEQFPLLWQQNKIIQSSLLSIKFISYFKTNQLEKALNLLHHKALDVS